MKLLLIEVIKLGIQAGLTLMRNNQMTESELDTLYASEKAKFEMNDPADLPDPQ